VLDSGYPKITNQQFSLIFGLDLKGSKRTTYHFRATLYAALQRKYAADLQTTIASTQTCARHFYLQAVTAFKLKSDDNMQPFGCQSET
jgi:hypothetical protein